MPIYNTLERTKTETETKRNVLILGELYNNQCFTDVQELGPGKSQGHGENSKDAPHPN